jgi:hypothetical protein
MRASPAVARDSSRVAEHAQVFDGIAAPGEKVRVSESAPRNRRAGRAKRESCGGQRSDLPHVTGRSSLQRRAVAPRSYNLVTSARGSDPRRRQAVPRGNAACEARTWRNMKGMRDMQRASDTLSSHLGRIRSFSLLTADGEVEICKCIEAERRRALQAVEPATSRLACARRRRPRPSSSRRTSGWRRYGSRSCGGLSRQGDRGGDTGPCWTSCPAAESRGGVGFPSRLSGLGVRQRGLRPAPPEFSRIQAFSAERGGRRIDEAR